MKPHEQLYLYEDVAELKRRMEMAERKIIALEKRINDMVKEPQK